MNIDKTIIFNVDGANIVVADLSTGLRKQFEIYDAYREELAKSAITYEMNNTAVQVKNLQLQDIIRKMNAPPAEEGEAAANE